MKCGACDLGDVAAGDEREIGSDEKCFLSLFLLASQALLSDCNVFPFLPHVFTQSYVQLSERGQTFISVLSFCQGNMTSTTEVTNWNFWTQFHFLNPVHWLYFICNHIAVKRWLFSCVFSADSLKAIDFYNLAYPSYHLLILTDWHWRSGLCDCDSKHIDLIA